MGKSLRQFALLVAAFSVAGFLFNPLSAMFSEPFFEKLFDILGWNTEDFAGPFLMALSEVLTSEWFHYSATLAIGFGVGVWAHWIASKYDKKRNKVNEIKEQEPIFHNILPNNIRSKLDDKEAEQRIEAVELIRKLEKNLTNKNYNLDKAFPDLEEITNCLSLLENNGSFTIFLTYFSESVRHMKEARQALENDGFGSLLVFHPITSPVVRLLQINSEDLILYLAGKPIKKGRLAWVKDELGIQMGLMERIDFKAKIEEFNEESAKKYNF